MNLLASSSSLAMCQCAASWAAVTLVLVFGAAAELRWHAASDAAVAAAVDAVVVLDAAIDVVVVAAAAVAVAVLTSSPSS